MQRGGHTCHVCARKEVIILASLYSLFVTDPFSVGNAVAAYVIHFFFYSSILSTHVIIVDVIGFISIFIIRVQLQVHFFVGAGHCG